MDIAVLGIVATIGIAIIGSILKLSFLRTELHEKWKTKVKLSISGLNSNANTTLIKLRDKIDQVTALDGGVAGEFEPFRFTADPDELKATVNNYLGYIRKRDKVDTYYKTLLALPIAIIPVLSISLIILIIFVAKEFHLHPILENLTIKALEWLAVILGSLFALFLFLFVCCQQLLTSAQIASDDEC